MSEVNFEQRGYTLPEVLVALVLTSFFVGLIMMFTFSYWRYGASQEADLDTLTTRLNAGDILRDYISQSSGLIIQNSIADTNTLSPDPAIPSNLFWKPIHAIPGNTTVGTSGIKPLLYFQRYSQDSSGAFLLNNNQPYEDEYMIYLDGATKQMRMRTLASPAVGNKVKTSCPASVATAACPADRVIASDLSSVDMRYFSRTGNLVNYQSIVDANTGAYIGPDYPVVEVVELSLNLSKKPFLQQTNTTQNSTVIRIALRNT